MVIRKIKPPISENSIQSTQKIQNVDQRINEQLSKYVKSGRSQGFSDEQIKQRLLQENWDPNIIKNLFNDL